MSTTPLPTALGYMQACSETGVAAVTSSSRPQLQDSAFQRLRESPAPLPVATAALSPPVSCPPVPSPCRLPFIPEPLHWGASPSILPALGAATMS